MSSAPAAELSIRKWYSPGGIAFSKFMTLDATTTNSVPGEHDQRQRERGRRRCRRAGGTARLRRRPAPASRADRSRARCGAGRTHRPAARSTAPAATIVAGPATAQSTGMFMASAPTRSRSGTDRHTGRRAGRARRRGRRCRREHAHDERLAAIEVAIDRRAAPAHPARSVGSRGRSTPSSSATPSTANPSRLHAQRLAQHVAHLVRGAQRQQLAPEAGETRQTEAGDRSEHEGTPPATAYAHRARDRSWPSTPCRGDP